MNTRQIITIKMLPRRLNCSMVRGAAKGKSIWQKHLPTWYNNVKFIIALDRMDARSGIIRMAGQAGGRI